MTSVTRDSTRASIERILKDATLGREERIAELQKIYFTVRAEQRAATESAMVDDPDIGAELKEVELALKGLDAEIPAPEDRGAATL
jgi:hypothetical protein